MLLATGRWPEAERALESALATHARYIPQMGAPTAATMAELRVRQGRLAEAERLLAGREENPSSLRALALLRIAGDQAQTAAALLERGLRATGDDAVRATQLLAPLVDARLACGDADGADEAAAQARRARRHDRDPARRGARRAGRGPRRAAPRRPADAAEPARRALSAFTMLAMPFDVGEARLELARALAAEAPELARDEARTALAAFDALGASRAMDAAAAAAARTWAAPAGARAARPGRAHGP